MVPITGAPGGIGAALPRSYAQPGRILVRHGRQETWLAALAGECETHGTRVVPFAFDLRDAQGAARSRADLRAAKIGRVELGQTGAAQDGLGNDQS